MALLTSPQAHGLLLVSIVTFLSERGTMGEEEVTQAFCPPRGGDDWPPALYSDTVKAGVALGVLRSGRGKLEAGGDLPSADPRDALRRWVFDEANVGPTLFEGSSPGSTDLVRGLCWLLTLDPLDAPVAIGNMEARQRGRGLPSPAVKNREQYRAVARWAVWLEIAQPTSDTGTDVVPDLRPTLRRHLPAGGGSAELETLLQEVRSDVPVIDGGWARGRYLAEVGTVQETLSASLSHALESLEFVDVIKLSSPQDAAIAGTRVRHLAGTGRPVSLVEVVG